MIALTAARLFAPPDLIEQPLLLLEDGKMIETASRSSRELPRCRTVDLGDVMLAPAFVDLHIHGGAGHDVMESSDTALPAVETLIARHGVSSYFPTTVTAPVEQLLGALERLAAAIEMSERQPANDNLRARPLGIHLEGPFISHQRRGVHPAADLLPPTVTAFERFWQASRGRIRMMTIAPELPGAIDVICEAARRGVLVSLGHSDADFETTRAAIEAGARHATHTFNAMRPLAHRDPGIIGEVLTDPRLSADIIVDGVHLDPAVVKLVLQMKGESATILITDATAATGMPDGRYRLGSLEVEVTDGKCMAEGRLAGSVLTMDRAVRNVMHFGGWSLLQALRAAAPNPARVAKLRHAGTLQPGSWADIVVLGWDGEVRKTIIQGRGV